MSKYLYKPCDIALYFSFSNFTISDEKKIRDTIWEDRFTILDPLYRNDKYKYIKEISKLIHQYEEESFYSEMHDINKVLEEIGSIYIITEHNNEDDSVEAFFRYIKLRLTYTENVKYVRFKLRTLLREFGYKKRTDKLVGHIKKSLKALKLVTYLREYQKCDISEINLDDTIVIRLKE